MSMMLFDRDPKFQPYEAAELDLADAGLDDEAFAGDLYGERDSLLESELLESSLDDYDDLLSAVRDDFCEL